MYHADIQVARGRMENTHAYYLLGTAALKVLRYCIYPLAGL